MRDILFRGKTKSGEWKFGYLFAKIVLKLYFILEWESQWMVDPETVGQYTGLTDKNGQKIYEGDIIVVSGHAEYPIYIGFEDSGWYGFSKKHKYYRHRLEAGMQYEVIGNIHDNPELLKEDE